MPYFQRKPIEALETSARTARRIAGLPSRGPAEDAEDQRKRGDSAAPGIVELADAVLASARPGGATTAPTDASFGTPPLPGDQTHPGAVRNLDSTLPPPAHAPAAAEPRDATAPVLEPAPVLSASAAVAPGGTAQIVVSLVNEDEEPARIVFFGTGLVGDDGALIPAERLSFQPLELILEAGKSGDVTVEIGVPANAPGGTYSGLIRASQLDDLHAVVVVRVEER